MYQQAAHAEQEYIARKRVAAARGQWTASRQHFTESGKQLKAGVEAMWTCVRATPYLAMELKQKAVQKIDEKKRAKTGAEGERGGGDEPEAEAQAKNKADDRAGAADVAKDNHAGGGDGGGKPEHGTSEAKNGSKGKDAA